MFNNDKKVLFLGQEFTYERLKSFFHMPIKKAARKALMSETSFKKVCRIFGVVRWPFRKYQSIEHYLAAGGKKEIYESAKQAFDHDPNFKLNSIITKKELARIKSLQKQVGRKKREVQATQCINQRQEGAHNLFYFFTRIASMANTNTNTKFMHLVECGHKKYLLCRF